MTLWQSFRARLHKMIVGLDQFLNVLTGGNLGETISSRAGRAAKQGKWWGKALSWVLGKIQRDHCEIAIQADKERAEALAELEEKAQK